MMSTDIVFYTFFIILPLVAVGQFSSDCENKETCRDCIQEIGCVWCIKPVNKSRDEVPIHCVHETTIPNNWCEKNQIISPKSSRTTLEDVEFTTKSVNPIHFKPQRIRMSVRKGEKIDVHFKYRQSENYPVDLYYIMDLSKSMDTYRKSLGELGVELAEALGKLTNDVKLGFGSFIDKVDLPFVSTTKKNLQSPCPGCVSPYSFKNHLSLSNDYMKFKMEVTNANVSGNLDTPEGGLDAIMQAIVCKEINWRSQARHLLVFSTDAQFHIAGDGKLAGVIEPNDAKCHMSNNLYTHYLKYDYPSVSQINHVAKENNINIIFAIVKKDRIIKEAYQMLSEHIENSNFGELQNDDSNTVKNLVVKNYKKIVQSVTMTSNATDDVDVKFSSSCKTAKPNGCGDVHVGEIVDFTATIQPRKCLSGSPERKIIAIKPEALHERLIIELDVICDCPCSSSKGYNVKSNECNRNGYLECGICKCASGRFGRYCQCDSSDNSSKNSTNCIANDQAEICSGQGECKCGKCECNTRPKASEKIYGTFCQCNNYSCKREGGILCSGKGTCDCGFCNCIAGYTGDTCQCPDTNSTCIAPGSDLVCSGYGKCVCGQCECSINDRHSGKYCEECTTCPAQRCEELRHCVECQAYKGGLYSEDECKINCTAFNTKIVNKFGDDEDIKKCRIIDKAGCLIIFEYTYNEEKALIVKAQKNKICAGPPNVLAWILGVIGTILIAGLIMLIIWKVCTTIHDRREYAKFENERKALKWHRNDNPLYRDATSTFCNPVYNRSVSKS